MQVFDPNTPEGQEQIRIRRKRHDRAAQIWFWIAVIVGTVLAIGGDLAVNQWWYGDWQCAYLNCVRATEVKQP